MFSAEQITNLLIGLIVGLVAVAVSHMSFREQRKSTYMQFYEIISRHHSEEMTALRREIAANLEREAEKAKQAGCALREIDNDLHLKTSAFTNYYEGLAIFLRGGWDLFPAEARETMLMVLHNSVCWSWPLINDYRHQIHPEQPDDWARNFEWLHAKTCEYEVKHNLRREK